MNITNNTTDFNASWFCFNSNDVVKLIALGSGNLDANGGSFSYQPPNNDTGLYYVRFTPTGGGNEVAGGTTRQSGQTITLTGSGGQYNAAVTTP
jgi:hypothetical protein